MIRNIKETFPPKTGLLEKQLLQDPGYVEDVEDTLLNAACAGYSNNTIDSFNYFSTKFK